MPEAPVRETKARADAPGGKLTPELATAFDWRKIAYLVHNLDDPAVERRCRMLERGGSAVVLAGCNCPLLQLRTSWTTIATLSAQLRAGDVRPSG